MFHGQKRYLQVLLDPNRADLLDAMAAQQEKRTTALVREIVYEVLEQRCPPEAYEAAVARDAALRADAIERQVAGRKRNRPKPA
ncbi:MAG: hypothetical protein ACO3GP_04660 [Candidatus Limnocylindrus sp.]